MQWLQVLSGTDKDVQDIMLLRKKGKHGIEHYVEALEAEWKASPCQKRGPVG